MTFRKTYSTNKKAILYVRSAQDKSVSVEFPAFLTTFTNNFSSQWSDEVVYGRQDPIGTFQSTKRNINVGFDIISYDLDDAKENMNKLNTFVKMLYPSYTDSTGTEGAKLNALVMSKAPLVEIKLSNLIQEQNEHDNYLLGWISNWQANPVLEMGMFTDSNKLFPKVYSASLDFTPQHRADLAFNKPTTGSKAKFPYDGG